VSPASEQLGERTRGNLYEAFVGEAKAHVRLLGFARKAEEEGYPQMARLFRAIAAAEEVHAASHLRVLGEAVVKSTEENLAFSFERESTVNEVAYPQFIVEAEEEGARPAVVSFSYARDVEEGHAGLYKKAMDYMLQDEDTGCYVCGVCGHTSDRVLPEECPICGATSEAFTTID
jgi:rubrerythrin